MAPNDLAEVLLLAIDTACRNVMCELIRFLATGVWEIVIHALGIGAGTALAYYLVIGPILRNNEKRKKEEEIIEKAVEFVYEIRSNINEIAAEAHEGNRRGHMAALGGKVNGFVNYVEHKIKSTIPTLADALHTYCNRLTATVALHGGFGATEITDSREVNSAYADRLRTEVPDLCQSLTTILNERKREAFGLLFAEKVWPFCNKLTSSPVWKYLKQRLR